MKNSRKNKIIAFNGSPLKGSNTDLITKRIIAGAEDSGFEGEHVYLNDLNIIPCQSCGESPKKRLCFFEDDLFPCLHKFAKTDIVVVSSPIFFDTVSAQTKLFIDRCNCFKPLEGYESGNYKFSDLKLKERLGLIVLVGGEREKYQHAHTVVKGFFIWSNVKLAGEILYAHADYELGGVKNDADLLERAYKLGKSTAQKIKKL